MVSQWASNHIVTAKRSSCTQTYRVLGSASVKCLASPSVPAAQSCFQVLAEPSYSPKSSTDCDLVSKFDMRCNSTALRTQSKSQSTGLLNASMSA